MESADSTSTVRSRKIKLTAKANDEKLQRVVSARKYKLGQLTSKMNQMVQLMDEGDDSNLQIVQTMLAVQFNKLFGEFCELNTTVKALLQQNSEDEMNEDQDKWFEPRANTFEHFLERAKAWMKEVHLRMAESEKHNEEVEPSGSVSVVSITSRKQGSISSSSAHSKASSSASAARLKAELERAALLAKASALKQRQELDTQEAKAKQEAEAILARLKLQREELEIQTALAASDAKFKVLDEFECLQVTSRTPSPDGMNSYIETAKTSESQVCNQLKITPHRSGSSVVREHIGNSIHSASNIATQPEQETLGPTQAITEFLVRQQKLAALPPQNIPIFNGDPMDYRLFIRAFEHGVEDKTDSCRDRLYYMEQYTREQHTMEHCKKMIRSLHKEKIDFLRNKGLCFSCLKSGHMSKACEDRLSCQYCQMSHPTVLHMKAKVVPTEVKHKGVPSDNGEGQSVISGCIGAKKSTCGATARDNVDSILVARLHSARKS
ncbi:hypothetical protein SRHO_G00334980 [Serrasalmus rhombeus]